jgi:hypothetical protein
MKYDILDKSGKVIFTADIEIECDENCDTPIMIGLAVKYAIYNKINMSGANLSGADLRGVNLRGVNLSGANLSCATLSDINLSNANLSDTNLSRANLSYANLSGANLSCATLSDINLSYANLSGAYMRDTYMRDANLSYANLIYANLSYAILSGANLSYTNLSYTILSGAYLRDANLRVVQTDIWTCYIQKEHIRIGCKFFTIGEWLGFSDEEISKMDSNALAWWKVWKTMILNIADTLCDETVYLESTNEPEDEPAVSCKTI